MAQGIKLKKAWKRKLQKQNAAALGTMCNIREKEKQVYIFPLSTRDYRMCRSTREEQNMDVWSAKKMIQQSGKKIQNFKFKKKKI